MKTFEYRIDEDIVARRMDDSRVFYIYFLNGQYKVDGQDDTIATYQADMKALTFNPVWGNMPRVHDLVTGFVALVENVLEMSEDVHKIERLYK